MFDSDFVLNYYLALLSVQMAILGLVVAGIVTLMQMLHKARPRRVMRLLVRRRLLYSYVLFLAATLVALCAAAWAVAFAVSGVSEFFLNDAVGGLLLFCCLLGLLLFVSLVYKTRRLLEADQYLATYIQAVTTNDIRDYLFRWYSIRPEIPEPDDLPNDPSCATIPTPEEVEAWEVRFARTQHVLDPFQPIREYIKDNAFNAYDYGTASGLRFFAQLFDKTFAAIKAQPQSGEYYYAAKYLADSCEEFFTLFVKTASEKRQTDTILLVAEKGKLFVDTPGSEGLITILRCLEQLAKRADDEDEVILCIERIEELTDAYLETRKQASWKDIAGVFEEACLSVTRLAETYYLQKDNPLRTIPIIGHYTGEHRSVTTALVNFFDSYDDMGDRYPDVYPVRYFEAIEAVIEVLFARYGEIIAAGHETRGLNIAYRFLASRLYTMYRTFGIDAIEHHKPELLALSLANLRRVIKPAKNFGLQHEQGELVKIILELSLKGIATMGDTTVKDVRTVSMYAQVTLQKHADKALIQAALQQLGTDADIDLKDEKLTGFLKQLHNI